MDFLYSHFYLATIFFVHYNNIFLRFYKKKIKHREILKGKVLQVFFLNGFVVAGGDFLSYWNHQLIKFEEELRTLKLFCNYEKREINTFENFPCKISLCQKQLPPTFFFNSILYFKVEANRNYGKVNLYAGGNYYY